MIIGHIEDSLSASQKEKAKTETTFMRRLIMTSQTDLKKSLKRTQEKNIRKEKAENESN